MHRLISVIVVAALAACSSPNVRSASSYDAPKAPPVRQPVYNPYAPYGEANATWTPPTFNRDGTIVKPRRTVHSGRPPQLRNRALGKRRERRQPTGTPRHLLKSRPPSPHWSGRHNSASVEVAMPELTRAADCTAHHLRCGRPAPVRPRTRPLHRSPRLRAPGQVGRDRVRPKADRTS